MTASPTSEVVVNQVRPAIPWNENPTGPLFDPEEPLIERLAEVARKKPEQPTAGWYGIQRAKEPTVDVPPECMLYDDNHFKFALGKHPRYRNYPHEVPADAWIPPEEPFEFKPQYVVEPRTAKVPEKVATPSKREGFSKMESVINELSLPYSTTVDEIRELAADQKRLNAELATPRTNTKKSTKDVQEGKKGTKPTVPAPKTNKK